MARSAERGGGRFPGGSAEQFGDDPSRLLTGEDGGRRDGAGRNGGLHDGIETTIGNEVHMILCAPDDPAHVRYDVGATGRAMRAARLPEPVQAGSRLIADCRPRRSVSSS